MAGLGYDADDISHFNADCQVCHVKLLGKHHRVWVRYHVTILMGDFISAHLSISSHDHPAAARSSKPTSLAINYFVIIDKL